MHNRSMIYQRTISIEASIEELEAILEKVAGENAIETELKQKCTVALNKLKERHGISLLFDRQPML